MTTPAQLEAARDEVLKHFSYLLMQEAATRGQALGQFTASLVVMSGAMQALNVMLKAMDTLGEGPAHLAKVRRCRREMAHLIEKGKFRE